MGNVSGIDRNIEQDEWFHINQTVQLLNVATSQVKISMCEGDISVGNLVDSFVILIEELNSVQIAINKLTSEHEGDKFEFLELAASDIKNRVQNAIVAFQFHDKMSQRLEHVTSCLEEVSKIISSEEERGTVASWEKLREKLYKKYSIESERLMFDAILSGASVADALEVFQKNAEDEQDKAGDIELF